MVEVAWNVGLLLWIFPQGIDRTVEKRGVGEWGRVRATLTQPQTGLEGATWRAASSQQQQINPNPNPEQGEHQRQENGVARDATRNPRA